MHDDFTFYMLYYKKLGLFNVSNKSIYANRLLSFEIVMLTLIYRMIDA